MWWRGKVGWPFSLQGLQYQLREGWGISWGVEDFSAAVALLGGAGITFVLVHRSELYLTPRIILSEAVVVMTLAIWAELAVSIF